MDLDAFTAVHSPQWERLRVLTRKRRLDGAEADELVRLYQAVATHLSTVRSAAPDPVLVTRLSDLLSRARVRVTGTHEPAWADVVRFVAVTVPAALYRVRWWTLGVVVVCLALAVVAGYRVATDPEVLAQMGTPAEREAYVNEAFASYYDPGASFAAMVWTNNAWIAAQCVGLGITGVWPAYVLIQNAVGVGATGGMMAAYDELDVFLQLIAPMTILSHQGSAEPVTYPSIRPDTASAPASPIATVTSARPSCASATVRGRGPGDTAVQKSLRPAAPATNTAVSSSSPWGAMSCRNTSSSS